MCTHIKRCLQLKDLCAHIEGNMQLKDVIVQAMFEALWKKLGKIIKRLEKLININKMLA